MRLLTVLTFLIIAIHSPAFSQDSISLNAIIEKKVQLSNQRPIEKVYLHFDKPYYALGDTVWFKAYLAMDQHLPSTLSKIVYVDVIGAKDSLIQSLKLQVNNSVASGSFTLAPLMYKQGNYRIRAYTTWMLNFKEDYFFYKNLVVGDAIEKSLVTEINFTSPSDKSKKLVADIAFKDQDGKVLSDKKVNWKVISGFEVISKGRVSTNEKGQALIAVEAGKYDLRDAVLVTDLGITNDKYLNSTFPLRTALPAKDLQFFPEGGNLISGLPCKVAFKAVKADGLGIDLKGTLVDSEGNKIVDFSSQHLGMGTVTFSPEAHKKYQANVEFSDGSKATFPLPEVKASGVSLSANNRDTSSVILKIMSNAAFLKENHGKSFYIIGESGGSVCYAAQLKLQSQVITANIEQSKFPEGIAQFTLLTSSALPLSERLVFIFRPGKMNLAIKPDKAVYSGRQKVTLNLSAIKLANEGNFSVAVINESKVPFDERDETTIQSSLLLSSDIKGYIEKPNYYFIKTNEKKLSDLDVLLLTQGYRSFSYPVVVSGNYPPLVFLPEQGIDIAGTLRMKNGMPVNKGNVRLIIPDKGFSAGAITDPEGRFRFSNLVFTDSAKVTLSAVNNVNSRNMMFITDGTAFPSIGKNKNFPDEMLNIDSDISVYLENSKRQYFNSRTLQEVTVNARVEKKLSHKDYPQLTGLSMLPDQEISGDRLKGCNVFLQCLQSSAPGLTFVDNNLYLTRSYNSGLRIPVQVFVKGMPVDVSFLNSVNPSEVESVEVFYKDDLSGINRRYNTNGIVVVNVREVKTTPLTSTQLKDLFPDTNTLTFTPQGYSKVRQFYVPKYTVAASSLSKPDLRTTVYWNPMVIPVKDNASVEFYNGDLKGAYKVVVEGMDKEGNTGRFITHYTVK